jgi:hypothetical protein
VKHKLYKEKIAQIKDSTGFVFHPTPSMEPVKKPANYVDTDFGFELWYKSADVEADIKQLTDDLKQQSSTLSTNTELPLFWSTCWGNRWDHLGRWGRENMSEWHISLPNNEKDAKYNSGDVSNLGQVWKVSIMPYDNYIRAYFQLDCIKSDGKYYQYDKGDHAIYIHKENE